MAHFAAFLGVATVVIVTPGPDTALTIRNALLGGRSGGVATAFGVATGQATWAVCTAVGVAALLQASRPAFLAVRVVGAAYLVFLGLQALIEAARGRSGNRAGTASTLRASAGPFFRQGLISNLGNPKMAVFFLGLLPQFTSGHAALSTSLVLGIVFCGMTFVWLTAYAVVVARAGEVLRRPRVRRALDAVTGFVLVALGLRLLAERR